MRAMLSFLFVLFTVSLQAAESIPGVDSHYRVVELGDGARLQSIIAVPDGATTPRYPLLFTQWVSCGGLEYREGSGSREILASLARDSGLALVRVERSALDDSGPACEALDYDTELTHYVEAFRQLLDDERIDPDRVYVYGSSLGSTVAPLVARELEQAGHDIAGIMVQGGGAVTYYERMLQFDRIYLERRPDSVAPADIHDEMHDRAKFHYEYLVEGRHPDDVAEDSEAMARIRNDVLGLSEGDHYGRPFDWHQQAARHNLLDAWAAVEAPVLVIYNEFDQYETRHGHALIADVVNRLRPGSATFVERPGIGHSNYRFASKEDAYADHNGTPSWRETAKIMVDWLRKQQ